MRVALDGETDLAGFRSHARSLLARGVPPDQVHWSTTQVEDDLFAGEPAADAAVVPPAAAVPRSFVELCGQVVLHRDPQRFALLYRLLWRLVREPRLRHDPLDADLLQARRMAQSVRRDQHKMRAFVRFRQVPRGGGQAPLHAAWYEPEHHVVQANAPWFMRRFAGMQWLILTPERSVAWDGQALRFGPGGTRGDAPQADAGEQLWLTYYASIFNPARTNLALLQQHIPRRYRANLPEASLIAPLAAQAQQRSARMIEQPPTQPLRRLRTIGRIDHEPSGIDSLPALRSAVDACRDCPHGAAATQGVCGEGALRAPLMLVGEQPGDREDLAGRPFVGPAGQLLDRALAQAGIDRSMLFLTNAVRHFGFSLRGQRRIHKTPGQREAAACAHWLETEIALVQPRALVALGATAARSLLQRPVSVTAERGSALLRPDGRRVFVTWHPSALLRMPPQERAAAFDRFAQDLAQAAGAVQARQQAAATG